MSYSEYDPGFKQRRPCNAGRKLGAKRALQPQHVWAIRFWLDRQRRVRDRAMFDLAIDSKLRGCDLVKIRVGDLISGAGSAPAPSSFSVKLAGPSSLSFLNLLARASLLGLIVGAARSTTSLSRAGSITLLTSAPGSMPVSWTSGCQHWLTSGGLRDTFAPADQGIEHIQADGQPPRCPNPARPYEDREYGTIPRRRH